MVSALLSSGVTVAAFELLSRRHVAEIENSVKAEYDRGLAVFTSERAWKEDAISQLLGPMIMQLDRTNRAFQRYGGNNTYLEAKVLVLPEFFFRGKQGAYPLAGVVDPVVPGLRALVQDAKWKDWFFCFGTLLGYWDAGSAGTRPVMPIAL